VAVAQLVVELTGQAQADILRRGCLPEGACYTFDARPGDGTAGQRRPPVYKTARRTVVSLRLGCFQAREVFRQGQGEAPPERSPALAALVPKGMRYDYELIAYVGTRSLRDGQAVGQVHQDLAGRCPAVEVPLSSLYDLRRKFLFLFGALHRQAAPALRRAWQDGPGDWLIDGTLEPGTPLFFGIQETRFGILLDCWKLPTEKAGDMAPCLRQAADRFGQPPRVVHDLGTAMAPACQEALPGVEQRACHFHFASDVGEDLYRQAQRRLSSRLRALGLQLRMHDQRKGQTDRLRRQVESGRGQLLLAELLAGKRIAAGWDMTLAREVLLALHGWIMNYPQDGRRQGFPFDPYLLYLHRRLLKAGDALDRLLAGSSVAGCVPATFANLRRDLSRYRTDPEVIAAAGLYEKAWAIFERLRIALRLSAGTARPLRDAYELGEGEQGRLCKELVELRADASRVSSSEKTEEARLYGIVSRHLEKYWEELGGEKEGVAQRTTNGLESRWGAAKRGCRRATGRGSLSREFRALPAEYMLVGNLAIARYVEVVVGSPEKLPEKLAFACRSAGTYSHWCRQQQPVQMGRLPRRLLAQENFLEDLLGVCDAAGKGADLC
jgi:hypothetical protein